MSWPGARRSYDTPWTPPVAPGAEAQQPRFEDDCCEGDVVLGPTPLNAPSGYAVLAVNLSIASPVLAVHDPLVGAFVRDMQIAAAAFGAGQPRLYIPAYAPSGIVGGGLFGGGAIGHRVPYHGKLVPSVVNGFTVYEPASPSEGPQK